MTKITKIIMEWIKMGGLISLPEEDGEIIEEVIDVETEEIFAEEEIIEEIEDLEELEEVMEEVFFHDEGSSFSIEEVFFHDEGSSFSIEGVTFRKNTIGEFALRMLLKLPIIRKGETQKDIALMMALSVEEFYQIEEWIQFDEMFIEESIPQCKVKDLPKGVRRKIKNGQLDLILIDHMIELCLNKVQMEYVSTHEEIHEYIMDEEIPYYIRQTCNMDIIQKYLYETTIEDGNEEEEYKSMSPKRRVAYLEKYYNIPYKEIWEIDGFQIRSPSSFHDLAHHGNLMDNCVGGDGSTYPLQIAHGYTKVYFMEKHQQPLVTIEIKNCCVVQAKESNNNKINDKYYSIIEKWAKENRFSMMEREKL